MDECIRSRLDVQSSCVGKWSVEFPGGGEGMLIIYELCGIIGRSYVSSQCCEEGKRGLNSFE